ncbi:MAG TPA: hypothetical protein ENN03_05620 [bacterium]|nr:hypothetical protein [bacterium]
MVDINLFRDEEEKEEKDKKDQWETPEGDDDLLDKELGDELMFEEESSKSSSLFNEELLGEEEEAIPDFDVPDDTDKEDYEFGEVKARKTSPGVWIALGVVIIAAGLYLFVLQPKGSRPKEASPSVKRPASVVRRPQTMQEDAAQELTPQPASKPQATEHVAEMVDRTSTVYRVPTSTMVNASRAAYEDLSRQRQFGAVLINGDRFHVEYVSETPNVANAMGHRIKTLMGAASFKASPEDRHQTSGRYFYWGVISGVLPTVRTAGTPAAGTASYASEAQFKTAVQQLITKYQMASREFVKLSESREAGGRQLLIRVKTDGSRANALAFLNGLKSFEGNHHVLKLLLAPVEYADFQGDRVKIVLDFAVQI